MEKNLRDKGLSRAKQIEPDSEMQFPVSLTHIHTLAAKLIESKRHTELQTLLLPIAPEASQSAGYLAQSYFDCGKFSDAAKWFLQAAREVDDAGLWENAGISYYRAGCWAESADAYIRAVEVRPRAGTYFNLGAAYERLGLLAQAEENFRAGLNLGDATMTEQLAIGWCRIQQRLGAADKGPVDLLNELVLKHPTSHDLWLALIFSLHRLGQPQESMSLFNYFHRCLGNSLNYPFEQTKELLVLHTSLWAILTTYDNEFGGGGFYQSFEELMIPGMRPTAKRWRAYGLEQLLRPHMQLLDLGCNQGFLAIKASKHVRRVVGIDDQASLIQIGKKVASHIGANNVELVVGDAKAEAKGRFDAILSCAFHQWVNLEFPEYVGWIKRHLNPKGLVLLESNNLDTHDRDFDQKVAHMLQHGFEPVLNVGDYDDSVFRRAAVIVRRR